MFIRKYIYAKYATVINVAKWYPFSQRIPTEALLKIVKGQLDVVRRYEVFTVDEHLDHRFAHAEEL